MQPALIIVSVLFCLLHLHAKHVVFCHCFSDDSTFLSTAAADTTDGTRSPDSIEGAFSVLQHRMEKLRVEKVCILDLDYMMYVFIIYDVCSTLHVVVV